MLYSLLFSCKKFVSQEKEVPIEQTKNQNQAKKIALNFINDYMTFCDDRNSELG